MDWIDIAWPLMAGISCTLALIYLFVWTRQRGQPAILAFALVAIEMAALAILELKGMQAQTPVEYATVLHGAEFVVALVPVSLVGFVLFHFRAGSAWLGGTASLLRAVCLLESVISCTDTRFLVITGLQQLEFLGATVSAPVGPTKPSMWAMELADLLLILFLASTIVEVRRRTEDRFERQRVMLVCGSMIAFVAVGTTLATAMALGLIAFPLVVALPFLFVVLVMAYDLGGTVERAARLEEQLRENELRLRGTEQRLQLTAEAVGLCLWTWDLRSNEQWFTETGGALLGLRAGGRMDQATFLARVHPEDRGRLLRARDDALLGDGHFECEYRLRTDGDLRWISATGRIEQSTSGDAPIMRGVLIDITERRQAEERFRLVVERSPFAKLLIDQEGRIAFANPQAATLFGYAREDMVGRSMDMLVPDRVRSRHPELRRRYFQDPRPRSMGHDREVLARRRDGSEVPVEISLTPVHMGDAQLIVTTVTDISERLRNEHEIASQRDELAHLSRISLLGEMSASLAHELNQPLTAVLSNAQAALRFLDRETPDLVEVRESLLHIVENDKRAGEVIRRLRAMLRKEQSDHQPLVLNEVVHDVLRLVNSDLLNRGVQAELALAPDLPRVLGDRVQLQQVLMNLIVNACDAMALLPSGDRIVEIRTGVAPDGQVRLTVADAGPGIPPADLERIFTPFVTTKPHGMGLGLAVCRTILQAHQGTLRARNGGTGGAAMVMLLPRLDAATTSTAEAPPAQHATP